MDILLKYFSDFTPHQLEQFKALDGVYEEWNEKINVISRKDIDGLCWTVFSIGIRVIWRSGLSTVLYSWTGREWEGMV